MTIKLQRVLDAQCHVLLYRHSPAREEKDRATDGKKFDSSRDTTNAGRVKDPISFPQGFRRVIAGWDLGFQGMSVGGSRRLIIPWQLAYGEKGRPPVIPERATLIFDVELMQVADTLPRPDGPPRPAGQAPSCPSWNAVKAAP